MSIGVWWIVPILAFSVGVLIGMAVMSLLVVLKGRDE